MTNGLYVDDLLEPIQNIPKELVQSVDLKAIKPTTYISMKFRTENGKPICMEVRCLK